ncbi:uncharacterized protein COLE_06369 [Cutaneotrichosporon oleaginosum]|uniref:uncharacterized protein n=1 Tax=Cutaneotrichosporon oleaginosum TaxID=879819 RepID=UPI00132A2ACA|nr:hypothetical protein COLE_06369 [Cutaneotrichosporon oleaginosum]
MAENNIVVIGGSFAGHSLANALAHKLPATHRILLVEQNEFTAHLPGVVRGLVEPGWEERNLTAPTRQETVFKAGTRHRVLAPVRVLELLEGRVLLDTEFEGSTEVPFGKCIVATGSSQRSPLRPEPGATRAEYADALRLEQAGFGKATHVLVVGGGAVGVEVAGELTTHYPSVQVTIVHGRSRLLETGEQDTDGVHTPYAYPFVPESVSERVDAQLRARGVEVILNDRVRFPSSEEHTAWDGREGLLPGMRAVTLASGQTVHADCVFGGSGAWPNSSLVSAVDPTALVGGYVAVDPNFRILSSAPALKDVYALGDVANTGGRKTAGQAVGEARHLAMVLLSHLACEAQGRPPAAKAYAPGFLQSILVPIGEGRGGPGDGIGAGSVDLGWLGVWRAPEWLLRWFAKDYFCSQHFVARFQGEVGVKDL